ncbi:hypothetical protein IWX90DRAFT_424752 [Phyllosticta citrichinensis]|uniref:Secreted protein n=1 Tax=Phyllosticta citrichinensis TaxID=1130410 RepID=A0ABR1Y3H5_9PEZI
MHLSFFLFGVSLLLSSRSLTAALTSGENERKKAESRRSYRGGRRRCESLLAGRVGGLGSVVRCKERMRTCGMHRNRVREERASDQKAASRRTCCLVV